MLLSRNDAPSGQGGLIIMAGNWAGYRECYIGGDFFLIYRIDDSRQYGIVFFVRAGIHSEIFE